MSNATSTRALLGVMILVCAPAIAIIPPAVDIRLGGAERVGAFAYAVHEGDLVTLAVTAGPGDLIWAFAAVLNDQGEADYGFVLTLLMDLDSKTGRVQGNFAIPTGIAGKKFQIEAVALSDKGEVSWSTSVVVEVLKSDDHRAVAVSAVLDQ